MNWKNWDRAVNRLPTLHSMSPHGERRFRQASEIGVGHVSNVPDTK